MFQAFLNIDQNPTKKVTYVKSIVKYSPLNPENVINQGSEYNEN